jgi:hypothetical protein
LVVLLPLTMRAPLQTLVRRRGAYLLRVSEIRCGYHAIRVSSIRHFKRVLPVTDLGTSFAYWGSQRGKIYYVPNTFVAFDRRTVDVDRREANVSHSAR